MEEEIKRIIESLMPVLQNEVRRGLEETKCFTSWESGGKIELRFKKNGQYKGMYVGMSD